MEEVPGVKELALPLLKLPETRLEVSRGITPRTKRTWDFKYMPSPLTFIDTVDSEVLANLSPSEVQRQAVIFELISTEENYNKDLDIIKRVFLVPIRDKQLLTKEEILQLFANVESIIELNRDFLKELKELQIKEQIITSIGPLLLKWSLKKKSHQRLTRVHQIDKFVIYLVYCSNHSYITERLHQFKSHYPNFLKFIEECFLLPECRLLYLDSFLIAPLQRICKYPLLFRELDKHTEEGHGDSESMKEASKAMANLLTLINERTRQAENIDKMISWMDLITAKRIFIQEGTFIVTAHKKQLKEVHVYLFNDMMLITRKRNNRDSLYRVLNRIPLNAALVRTQKDVPHIKDNSFEVVHMGDVVYTFEPTTQTAEEMRLWGVEIDKQATAALEDAVRLHEHRRTVLNEAGEVVGLSIGKGSGGRSQKGRLDGDPIRRTSLLNFFLGGFGSVSDTSPGQSETSLSASDSGISTSTSGSPTQAKSGSSPLGNGSSGFNSGFPTGPHGSPEAEPMDTFTLRGAKEVLRESMEVERRLKLAAQEKAQRLEAELERLRKKYRSLKDKTNLLDRVDKRMASNYDGKREVEAARAHVKELRQERNVLDRELYYQQEDNKHLEAQAQALEERAEMHQQLLLLYSQQVASLMLASSLVQSPLLSSAPTSPSPAVLPGALSSPSTAALSLLSVSPLLKVLSSAAPYHPASSSPYSSPSSSSRTLERRLTSGLPSSHHHSSASPKRRNTSMQRSKGRSSVDPYSSPSRSVPRSTSPGSDPVP